MTFDFFYCLLLLVPIAGLGIVAMSGAGRGKAHREESDVEKRSREIGLPL